MTGWQCPGCKNYLAPSVSMCSVCYKVPQAKPDSVVDAKPEDLVAPVSPFEEIDENEVLYWSTGYYDEYMAEKQKKLEHATGVKKGDTNGQD